MSPETEKYITWALNALVIVAVAVQFNLWKKLFTVLRDIGKKKP